MAIAAHDAFTIQNAMWIARATVLANQQPGDPGRDTQASRARAAEAAAAKRRTKAAAAAAAKAIGTQQPSSAAPTASTNITARSPANGGHTLETTDTDSWCTVCRTKSLSYDKLAPQTCNGSAVVKWAVKAYDRSIATAAPFRKHCTVKRGPVFWCVACGAFAESTPNSSPTLAVGSMKGGGLREA